jgi:hypothetical protein
VAANSTLVGLGGAQRWRIASHGSGAKRPEDRAGRGWLRLLEAEASRTGKHLPDTVLHSRLLRRGKWMRPFLGRSISFRYAKPADQLFFHILYSCFPRPYRLFSVPSRCETYMLFFTNKAFSCFAAFFRRLFATHPQSHGSSRCFFFGMC